VTPVGCVVLAAEVVVAGAWVSGVAVGIVSAITILMGRFMASSKATEVAFTLDIHLK
jgi:hypothetical protein